MNRTDRPRAGRLIARWTIVLLALSVAWRVGRFALSFPIWGDEAFVAVSLVTRGFRGMLEPLAHIQIVPVGFMWTELAAGRALGFSPDALRVVPLLAGTLSLFVFWRLAPRLLDRRSAFLALALFAASYYPMRHANEIKPYSFDLLAALLITTAGWKVWGRPHQFLRWSLLGAAAALAVWCSYPSVFVSGGVLATLAIVVHRERSARVFAAWLATGLVLAASFVAMYVLVAKGQEHAGAALYAADGWAEAFPPIREPWRLPGWFLATHTGNLLAYPVGGTDGGSTATFILVLVGAVAIWRRRRPVGALLLAPLALTLVAAGLGRYPYGGSARVAQHLAPMICLLAGAGLVATARALGGARVVRGTVGVTPWIMAVIIVVGLARDVWTPYKGLDDETCRAAMAWLRSTRAPGDVRVFAGRFDDRPENDDVTGPDLRPWGGRAARVRYELLVDRPGPLLWSPDVHELPHKGVVWLIAYFNANAVDGDASQLHAYIEAAHERLGAAEITRFEIDPDFDEWVEFHRFEPSG